MCVGIGVYKFDQSQELQECIPFGSGPGNNIIPSGSKYDPAVVAACLRLFNEKYYQMEG